MNPTPDYLGHVDALLADPLRVARAAAESGAAVGYIGDDIPVSLILAANALPVRLRSKPGRSTPRADEFMESAFTPALRALAEDWLEGQLDFLKAVVFPRSDDSAQRLYYYLCELQRRGRCAGPRPLLYDLARIPRPSSVAHNRDSTRRLAEALGAQSDSLGLARERIARREALMADLQARRQAQSPLAGSLAWRLHQAADSDWREEFDLATLGWLGSAPSLIRPLRIVLAGDAHPDDALHRTIEAAGGSVILELTDSIPGQTSEGCLPLDALADQFHTRRNPVLAMRENPEWVVSRARDVQADAVVFWLIEEDEAMPWEVSRQMRALTDQRLPTLLLTRQRWVADENARRQVSDFVSTRGVTT